MQLFYAPDLEPPVHTLGEEESKHCIRVLRLGCGDTLKRAGGRGRRGQTLYPTELQSHISVTVVSSNNDIIAKSTLLVNTFLQLFFRFFADSFFFGSRLMFFQPTAVNEEA